MEERPKASITSATRVRASAELALDFCKSRENCTRRWPIIRAESELVSDATALTVLTCSSPFSLVAKWVTGLAGSKNTLFCP